MVFARQAGDERVIVAINASEKPVTVRFKLPVGFKGRLKDILNPGGDFSAAPGGELAVEIPACWGRFLKG
jgi:hypothetical protein